MRKLRLSSLVKNKYKLKGNKISFKEQIHEVLQWKDGGPQTNNPKFKFQAFTN